MREIDLRYGSGTIPLAYDEQRLSLIGDTNTALPLTDAEIGAKLDAPIESPPLEELVSPGESILFVVPDATRRAGAGQIVNLLVRRLIANGTLPFDIRIIFATGIHREVTEAEKSAILTPFIYQRMKTLDHNPRDLMQTVGLGETVGGIPAALNRALVEHDHVILVGGVSFHYFAGFTGGRKLVCPGLASTQTISKTHKLAFDCETKHRRTGVDTGRLDGNAVHEAFVDAASKVKISFAVNTFVNDFGELIDLRCGHWLSSHQAACDAYAAEHTKRIAEKRDVVIASCGGTPFDLNLIQAHKALDAASRACTAGGTIVLLAQCSEGLGHGEFLSWFAPGTSVGMADELCERYQVNRQTAWSVMEKTERFDVLIVSNLDASATEPMKMRKIDADTVGKLVNERGRQGYILPAAANQLIEVEN
ncbi:MAG: nickel-dependent lactate racemase [Pyrinomonadaceae bacterium]